MIILSLSLLTPLILVASYMDDLRKIGTIFGQVIDILEKPDLKRPQDLRELPKGRDLVMTDVSFGYTDEEEVLHDISRDIKAGSINA